MRYTPEPPPLSTRWLHDVGRLATLAVVLIPVYLLCNAYWQSMLRLVGLYGLLALFCSRLGGHIRRVMRRLPAEIYPWRLPLSTASASAPEDLHFPTAEAIRHVRQDPHYVQDVLKPRLRHMLAYRLSGTPDQPLDTDQLAQVAPELLDFFQRQEATGLWARYRHRRQRVAEVLQLLRRLEQL